MKRILVVMLAALSLLTFSSCKKSEKAIRIYGDWELNDVEFVTKSAVVGDETVSVYIRFTEDNTFQLWQKLGEGRYASFDGQWTLTGNVLSGTYTNGKALSSEYEVSVNKNTMTLTTLPDRNDTFTYQSCTIPEDL